VSALAVDLLGINCVRPLKGGSRTVNRVWYIIAYSKRSKSKIIEISIVYLDSAKKSNTITTFHINNLHLPKGYCAN